MQRALALGLLAGLILLPPVAMAVSPSPSEKDVMLDDGLSFKLLKAGTGAVAKKGDTVEVHYTGWTAVLPNPGCAPVGGRKFDSSRDRGKSFAFKLGEGKVIKGWEEGLVGMREGERRLLTIPPKLAYGDKGVPEVIPPGATLSFDVELLKVN
jgi:FKBP-type peptidyl-prolyl cis-trans isomerase